MKNIKILGAGCMRCQKLAEDTRRAASELGLECQIEKITDIMEITRYGVMMTPALVVDNKVVLAGKTPSVNELKELLK